MKFFNKSKKEKKTANIELGNLYDINKGLVEKGVPELSKEEMDNKKNLIVDFVRQGGSYFMLLCNERKDYTVFHRRINNPNGEYLDCCEGYNGDFIEKVLIDECLPNRGKTKSIELTENKDAVEIWISIDGESYCYYFFPYDTAIIEC